MIEGGGGGSVKPSFGAPKPKAVGAQDATSEHGAGGGTGGNDVGVVPTLANVQSAYGDSPSVLDDGSGGGGGAPLTENSQGAGGPDSNGPGSAAPAVPDTDWADVFWGSLGLPADLISQINQIFKQYPDLNMAQAVAQNTLRNSTWFAATFPGFATGVKNGLFTDETGYRDYVNRLNVLSNQYNGRNITTDEVTGALGEGIDSSIFEKRLQANAYLAANQGQLQYELGAFGDQGQATPEQLQAFGRQQVGLDSQLGERIKAQVDKAVQRRQNIFQGSLAGPAGLTLGPQGLNAPGLAGGKASPATNVAA